jgi:UDP-N-acetylmuramoyl-tripeptide--D-alanyl-D-alanine ligase
MIALLADTGAALLALAGFLLFAHRRGLRYLHIFQQEEYDGRRFIDWLLRDMVFDKRLSLALLVIVVAKATTGAFVPDWLWNAALAAAFVVVARAEPDPTKVAKKKLAMTSRAQRTHAVAMAIIVLAGIAITISGAIWPWLLAVQAIPLALPVATLLLQPVERHIQKRYWQEAKDKLDSLHPRVVGITGSFGKTSVKHILGHILQLNSRTLITPGSVNTPMGVTRIIREQLKPGYQNFVVEMGAYGKGSIERLCRLAPPQVGIITAIGEAHYERFGSLDTVARTKFELAEAVLSNPGGRVIIHESVLQQPYAAAFVAGQRAAFVVCGLASDCDLQIGSGGVTATGLEFEAIWQGTPHRLAAPIFGVHHIQNVAMAFAAALVLGIPADRAAASLKSLGQIKHRLEVKPQPGGGALIDDAYNSNPTGFAAALDLLPILKPDGGRAILVTPGMAELGARHEAAHREIGAKAAGLVDLALLVKPDRIPSFAAGFRAAAAPGGASRLLEFETFAQANAWLAANGRAGDVVLLENDLPDLYERVFET